MIATLALVQTDRVEREFTYAAPSSVRSVSLAGSFNNWDRAANPMRLAADGRTWTTRVSLPYGRIQYKFVLNGETWVVDPKGKSIDDGNGNVNSVLTVSPPDYARAASSADGVIAHSALRATKPNYDRGALEFTFRARPNDLRGVTLVANGERIRMKPAGADDLYATYRAKYPWNGKRDVRYRFELQDGPKTESFGAQTLVAATFRPFRTPEWPERTVFYQIFPDRFANGDPANDPKDVRPWGSAPTYANRFGGDVAGIEKHLGYLSALGIRGLYMTPVFKSPSNHRYDATDYKTIDPEFGTNAEFTELVGDLRERGIRTVMDFAFNHTATDFPQFLDIRKNGSASPYTSWYFIKSYPVVPRDNPPYEAWYGFPSMPKLNTVNPTTTDYLLGVFDFWKRAGIAGTRLDVANEVDPRFWRTYRRHVKSVDPSTWIVGEEWGDGTPWLGGDQWDSQMGYQFRDAALGFFADGRTTASEFLNRLTAVYASYPPQVSRQLMNLLSSHDTPRFLTLCKGNADLHRLAATVQLTWPGAPSVYYGEEIGMEGGKDPDNRRGMEWAKATNGNAMLAFYRRLIAARNANPVLQSGDPVVLKTDDANRTLAYGRVLGDQAAVVVVNRSDRTQKVSCPTPTPLVGKRLLDVLTDRQLKAARTLTVTLAPMRAAVLVAAGSRPVAIRPPSSLGTKVAQALYSRNQRR